MTEEVRRLAIALTLIEDRLRFLDENPTHPGGDREYRLLFDRYRDVDARLVRVMWEETR